jgi:hypothetical protein
MPPSPGELATDQHAAGGESAADAPAGVDALPPQLLARDYSAAVYGSLLVTTLIAVQWQTDLTPTFVAASLVISVVVFWLTHTWSRIVDRRVHGPIDRSTVLVLARDEAPMLVPALIPAVLLTLVRLDVYSVEVGETLALAVSLAQLFVWGLAVGRAAHGTWPMAIGVAIVDMVLGLLVVALKLFVLH